MANQEIYHSSTLGPIPLSFTGRRLLQNLREAFQELLQKSVRSNIGAVSTDWEDVSKARGKIAQYMSQLEKKDARFLLGEITTEQLTAELMKREWEPRGPWFGKQFNCRSIPIPLKEPKPEFLGSFGKAEEYASTSTRRKEYLCTYISKPPGPIVHTANGIKTTVELAGSVTVCAAHMDEALDLAVSAAGDHGYILERYDFDVRLIKE